MSKILCVEDAEDVILIIESALEGHEVFVARTLKEAHRYVSSDEFSCYLFDIELPDGSGLEFFASLPEAVKKKPIAFLTGKLDFANKASAFLLGADDYIEKPFDPQELRLRVESKIKKHENLDANRSVIAIGDLICSQDEMALLRKSDGRKIELTSHEFRIFQLLALAPSKIFTREEILSRIWTESVAVTTRTVDVHVSNLRKKMTGSSVTIQTVVGTGYRLKPLSLVGYRGKPVSP